MLVAQLQAVFPELYSTFYNARRGSVALVGSESQTQVCNLQAVVC